MSMASVPQRNNMSCDIANENNRCSNISDESVTAPPAPISSSSSEQDNHEANAWSSDYSNSEDEFPNVEDSVAPVSRQPICQLKSVQIQRKTKGLILEFFFFLIFLMLFYSQYCNHFRGFVFSVHVFKQLKKSTNHISTKKIHSHDFHQCK